MKRLCGMFCCILAALALWQAYQSLGAKIEEITILPAVIQRVDQIQVPGQQAQYFPVVRFECQGRQNSIRLIHNLPDDGMLPITATADGSPYSGSVSALAMWQSGGGGYRTEIVYFDNPDHICFARHYGLIQLEQKFYLTNAAIALGAGLFSLFWMFALGRRVNLDQYPRFRRSGKLKKPGYLAPVLLLLMGLCALVPALYYAAPLFNPQWTRVKATLASVSGSTGLFYAVTHRGLDRIPGPLLASQWSAGDLVDAYYDSANHMIHLASLESVSSLLALVLGLIGVLALCMALYLAEERRFLRRFCRRWKRGEHLPPFAPSSKQSAQPSEDPKNPSNLRQ